MKGLVEHEVKAEKFELVHPPLSINFTPDCAEAILGYLFKLTKNVPFKRDTEESLI